MLGIPGGGDQGGRLEGPEPGRRAAGTGGVSGRVEGRGVIGACRDGVRVTVRGTVVAEVGGGGGFDVGQSGRGGFGSSEIGQPNQTFVFDTANVSVEPQSSECCGLHE